jgi:hypothetical protein
MNIRFIQPSTFGGDSNISDFSEYVENSKVLSDAKKEFTAEIFKLKETLSTSNDYNEVVEIKKTLESLKVYLSKEDVEVRTLVRDVITVAKVHLHALIPFEKERTKALQQIPDRMISLEGVEQSCIGDFLPSMLKNTDGVEYSLKVLCGGIASLSNEQLPGSIEITEKLIDSLKDKGKVSELIDFCSKDPSKIQSLFIILDYLGLDEFQRKNLEPFSKVFPNVPLDQIPKTIKQLDVSNLNVGKVDFSKFEHLESIDLSGSKALTAKQFNSIPNKASILSLNLEGVNVRGFDFSEFTGIKNLDLSDVQDLTARQFNSISNKSSLENLKLNNIDIKNFDFLDFKELKGLDLRDVQELTAVQFNAISQEAKDSIEHLDLSSSSGSDKLSITGFDLSSFRKLKSLNLSGTEGLTARLFNAISKKARDSIEDLDLSRSNVSGFNFSGFTKLKSLTLRPVYKLTAMQLSTIPLEAKASIKDLDLGFTRFKDFDFSGFTGLKKLDLSFTKNLTAAQFNAIPVEAKASIESLDLRYMSDITGFDFSGFTGLKSLDLESTKGLTAEQFNAIPLEAKASIEELSLDGYSVIGVEFSDFVNLKKISFESRLTAKQFNTIPKDNLEDIDFDFIDLTGFDFSKLVKLKKIRSHCSEITAAQFNAIPNKHSIETLSLSGNNVNVTDFDFSRLTGIKELYFNKSKGLSAKQFNQIPNKRLIENLSLSDVGIKGFDFSELVSLKLLDLSGSSPSYLFSAVRALGFNYSAPFAKEFNSIPDEGRASIRSLYLGYVGEEYGNLFYRDITGYDFSGFTGLERLSLNTSKGLTAGQFNNFSNKYLIENLDLSGVDVTNFDFSGFTGLKRLDLANALGLESLPENIGDFSKLTNLNLYCNSRLTSLPTSILNLSKECCIKIESCGLSETVLGNLGRATAAIGYRGPQFSYSMSNFNPEVDDTRTTEKLLIDLYASAKKTLPLLENIPADNKELKMWLARLSWMADYKAGGERQEVLAKSIIGYIEKANSDPEFLDVFLAVINGASETCGDRMALSVINLGIAHQIYIADLSDAKSLANLFNRGVRAINMLEDIAKEKVKSLPFVDEVEIYLAYPTMLKEKLQLPINIEGMLYFTVCCENHIKQSDLDLAEEIVSNMINDQDSLKEFLITRDKWIEVLKHNYSQRMDQLEQAKENAAEEAVTGEDYIVIELDYKKSLIDLTTEALALA